MAFTHTIDRQRALVVVTGQGLGAVEEAVEAVMHLLDDPAVVAGQGMLFDISQTTHEPTAGDLSRLAALLHFVQLHFHGPIAWVDGRPGRATSSILLAQELDSQSCHCRAFFTDSEARAWLLAVAAIPRPARWHRPTTTLAVPLAAVAS